ncbi:hypothetical protein K8Z61_10505 [Nocardioides sp. TRM66260-LWL]|uniref:hypothetical protein n=1 Tax=Nocardioides sp. TRM66260-LWL TaxID=2874478 RepID=UPI001CC80A41|nr:hypothetical protein [Nocardioides sp. TRM66260-LWL]MBZ5734927.1 hypothetical protein [Nocardioides sp. TRM66260-LWL]
MPEIPRIHGTAIRPTRRSVVSAAVWAAPTITVLSAAPAFASSGRSATVTETTGLASSGTGVVYLALDPAPTTAPAPVVVYDDRGASTTGFTIAGARGTAAIYRLAFRTTTRPMPATITVTLDIPDYGTANAVVPMTLGGTLDTRVADLGLNAGSLSNGNGLLVQPDGKILVAGDFSQAGTPQVARSRVARFTPDGTLDPGFTSPQLSSSVFAIALQPDGKILVGGIFSTVGPDATPRQGLVRLNADGTLDTSFANPGLNDAVYAIAVLPDGKILVAGRFGTAGPDRTTVGRLARLNANGTLDTGFADPNLLSTTISFTNVIAYDLAVQPDGKILVTGNFNTAGPGDTPRGGLARFNSNGTLDTGFGDASLGGTSFPTGTGLALQSDGKVLVAGRFTTVKSQPRVGLARLTANGTLDTGFQPTQLDDLAYGVTLQADGKVLLTGDFTTFGSGKVSRRLLLRLNADGSLDTGFGDPALTGGDRPRVTAAAVDQDGLIYVTGTFSSAGSPSTARGNLARFYG